MQKPTASVPSVLCPVWSQEVGRKLRGGGERKNPQERRVCPECQKTHAVVRFKTETHPPESASLAHYSTTSSPRACVQPSRADPGAEARPHWVRPGCKSTKSRGPQNSVPCAPASSDGAACRPRGSTGSQADRQLLNKSFIEEISMQHHVKREQVQEARSAPQATEEPTSVCATDIWVWEHSTASKSNLQMFTSQATHRRKRKGTCP